MYLNLVMRDDEILAPRPFWPYAVAMGGPRRDRYTPGSYSNPSFLNYVLGDGEGSRGPGGGYIANLDEPPGGADYEAVSFRLRPQRTDSSWRLAGMWGVVSLGTS